MTTEKYYTLKFNGDFFQPIMDEVKTSTMRINSKPIKIGDYCYAHFIDINRVILLKITDHYAKKVHDLNKDDAYCEGYLHEDLLKHELRHKIYPELKDDDYVYIYKFKGVTDTRVNGENVRELLNNFIKEHNNG